MRIFVTEDSRIGAQRLILRVFDIISCKWWLSGCFVQCFLKINESHCTSCIIGIEVAFAVYF